MIIIRIHGGLGNQMFQYAFGKSLALKNNTDLKLDLSWFRKEINSNRKYELDVFGIDEAVAVRDEIRTLKNRGFWGCLKKQLEKRKTYYQRSVIKENSIAFDENILKVEDNKYLDGYWQSEKYFCDIKKVLLEKFQIIDEPNRENLELVEKMKSHNSVSIHIRRGDYIANEKNLNFHGVCSLEYYQKAIDYFLTRYQDTHFYIFSDDLCWVRQNLKLNHDSTFVNINNDKKNYFDLYLMSNCCHNIIANSSFSWWSAWLNKNTQKVVVAPQNWFKNDHLKSRDIIPDSWKKM